MHNNYVSNVTDNINTIIETRMVRFIFNSINHSNGTCKNVLRVKLLSVNSTFAANYQYLSIKFDLTEADWYTSLEYLLGKVKKKIALLHPQPVLCDVLKELCAIRDNTSLCDIADKSDIVVSTIYVLIESMMSAIGVLVMYLSPLSMCVHDICM